MIDVQGSFCARKFNEKVKRVYTKYELHKCIGESPTERQILDDKHAFIKQVLSNLFVYKCMDAIEFNLAVRSLASFFKTHKGVGLLVVDGMHFMESTDFHSFDKKHRDKVPKVNNSIESFAD